MPTNHINIASNLFNYSSDDNYIIWHYWLIIFDESRFQSSIPDVWKVTIVCVCVCVVCVCVLASYLLKINHITSSVHYNAI